MEQFPGTLQAVAICLAIMMVLDLLVMYFIDRIIKTPGLGLVLAAPWVSSSETAGHGGLS